MKTSPDAPTLRYFLTYRSMALPLCLTEELEVSALRHRNTYFRASYDEAGRMLWVEKLVYDEVEMRHDYDYGADGVLMRATVHTVDEEPQVLLLGAGSGGG